MKQEKRRNSRKGLIAAVALVLLLCAAVGGTLAWITAQTPAVANTFTPAHVTCKVDETFKNNEKSNVSILNTSDIDAYIRAAIVVNWADKDGNVSGTPVTDSDYTMSLNLTSSGWVKGSDGYYYYTSPVAPGRNTEILITRCSPTVNAAPAGYELQVTILAEAIQAEGKSGDDYAVETVWPVTVNSTTKALSLATT